MLSSSALPETRKELEPRQEETYSQSYSIRTCEDTIKRVRGRRGALKELVNMPYDVMLEIFAHLGPLDLLRIAQTTRSFRALLMRRSAQPIWRKSRSNFVGLPECPKDLSEGQYALLVFDTHCYRCHTTNAQIVWVTRDRYCHRCGFEKFLEKEIVPDHLRSVVPWTDQFTQNKRRNPLNDRRYCKDTTRHVIAEYNSLSNDDDVVREWFVQKEAELKIRMEHAELGRKWEEDRVTERVAAKENIRVRRYEAIIQKLNDLGWESEIRALNDNRLRNHKLVVHAKELTDRIWKNIKPQILELMQNIKAERLKTEFRSRCCLLFRVYHEYKDANSSTMTAVFPSIAEIAVTEEFRSILEAPLEEAITEHNFEKAKASLPFLVRRYQESRDHEVLAILRRSTGIMNPLNNTVALSTLQLATTIFHCAQCNKHICHPEVVVHECATLLRPGQGQVAPKLFQILGCVPWNYNKLISLDHLAHFTAKSVLRLLGYNPAIATVHELKNANPFLECLTCFHHAEGQLVMRWHGIIDHVRTHISQHNTPGNFAALTNIDTMLAINVEEEQLRTADRLSQLQYRCIRCAFLERRPAILHHCIQEHGTLNPTHSADYKLCVDGTFGSDVTVLRIRGTRSAPTTHFI